MKADISADLHAPAKRYSGVRAQQGRVLTDADFNAAFDVVDESLTELVRNLVCTAGSTDAGFSISAAQGVTIPVPGAGNVATQDFTISPGSFVLGGRVHLLSGPRQFLNQTDWMSLLLTPGELPPAPVNGRHDFVYLESIVQPVRAVEDRALQERALGNADTTTRLRPQMRVRVLPDSPDECATATVAARALLAGAGGSFSDDGSELLSNARLRVRFVDDAPVTDPCAPRNIAGYLGAENQTLRIMLPEPGRFLWNYDHGGDYFRVQINAGSGEIDFLTEPRDPVLFPRAGQVIEILPWDVFLPNREKAAAPLGHLAVLTGEYDPPNQRIAYDGSMPPHWQTWLNDFPNSVEGIDDTPPRYFYARIWQEPEAGSTSQPTGLDVRLPGTGLALDFTGTGFAADYWTASFRTDDPTLVLPMRLGRPGGMAPIGPRRFYAPLALLHWQADIGGNLSVDIDDCRNRFRSLCRIKGCCTYFVGDGHVSFGDFNSVQAAVNALPAEGGEICLLPGRHEGLVDLTGKRNISIHGCGPRTRVIAPPGATAPVFDLTGANAIELRDFRIEAETRLAVRSDQRSSEICLHKLGILVTGTAIAFAAVDDLKITDCDIRSRTLTSALVAGDLAFLGPLVFLRGARLLLEGCRIVTESAENRNLTVPGGVQVGGGSRDILIRDNLIRGGNGNGISLGSVVTEGEQGGLFFFLLGWITIDPDGCIKIIPPGTSVPDPVDPNPPRVFSQGDLRDLEIRHNRIEDHGASGISVAHWFIAEENQLPEDLDDIEIEDAVIIDNTIRRCMALDLASSLPIEAAFASGVGGIVLSSSTDMQIENNDIRDCGTEGRSPFCGIYLRVAARTRITDNRIYNNGRPATLQSPLLVGSIGGIVINHVEGQTDGFATELRQTPAVFIKDNTIVSQEGRALELMGNGEMLIEGNSFTAHGNNSLLILIAMIVLSQTNFGAGSALTGPGIQGQLRSLTAQIAGSAVAIVNTGINPNLALAFGNKAMTTGPKTAEIGGADGSFNRAETTGVLRDNRVFIPGGLPSGLVMFNDNTVTFDALSSAMTLSFCSVGILTLDDVGMHDNHCVVETGADLVLINALVIGVASTRVQGNRFRERIGPFSLSDGGFRPLSAMTLGLLNATENNQGTHCFLRLGWKKPRVTGTSAAQLDLYLDTNRHVLSEELCDDYDQITRDFGT